MIWSRIRVKKSLVYCIRVDKHLYLFMDLLRRLGITESHSGQIFEDWHLHSAVASIKQRHQGAWVHRSIHNLRPNTCRAQGRRELIIYAWHKHSCELQKEAVKCWKCNQQQKVFLNQWHAQLVHLSASHQYRPVPVLRYHTQTYTQQDTVSVIWILPLLLLFTLLPGNRSFHPMVITSIIPSLYSSAYVCACFCVCVHACACIYISIRCLYSLYWASLWFKTIWTLGLVILFMFSLEVTATI